MDSELLRCTAAMLTVLSKAATQCDTLHRTLSRFLNRHPYSDTLNRPTSIGHVAATIPLADNTQLPTDSAEEPHLFGAPSDRHDEIRASTTIREQVANRERLSGSVQVVRLRVSG